jgi:hypothetical protein
LLDQFSDVSAAQLFRHVVVSPAYPILLLHHVQF